MAVLIAIYLAGIATLGIYVVTHSKTSKNSKLLVVAGENVWGNIASQIGGDKVQVTSIISDPGVDPHAYQSNAHDALVLSQAKLVIANGLGYDDFLTKLMEASPNAKRNVLTVSSVLGVAGKDANPHLWYDITRVPDVAQAIETAMAAQDPADAALFAANLQKFDTSLQPLLNKIVQIKTQFVATPVAYTERVPGYLLGDMGLTVKTPAGFASAVENGNDPSLADQSAMNALITSNGIKALLYNSQATSPTTAHLKTLAQQYNIPVVGVTETIPAQFATYQAWQSSQLDALQHALQGK